MVVRIWLMAATVAAALAVPLQAGQKRLIGDPSRDAGYTMQAHKLLADDPDLAGWNIGVMVNDRVAILWGPAPSAEVAFRAELCLKAMVELVEVRNELIVSELSEPARRPIKFVPRPRNMPELMPPRLPEDPRWKLPPSTVLTGQVKIAPPQTITASKRPAELMPSAETISDADRALTASIRVFLESKTAYRVVQFTVRDLRVFLKAAGQDSDALHEAARGISRLPNVEGVVLSPGSPPR